MSESIKYVADIEPVREVSLLGTAQLEPWREQLDSLGLVPTARDGHAQVLVIAADMTFKGVHFREMSFSVRAEEHSGRGGALLIEAFNTCRLFAAAERWLFSTPYRFGHVEAWQPDRPTMALRYRSTPLFQATLNISERKPIHDGEDYWFGPVFLPRRSSEVGRFFVAHLTGRTQTYSFIQGEDQLLIAPDSGVGCLRHLVDSGFTPRTWTIREKARHRKSKTYSRILTLAELKSAASGPIH